MMRWTACVNVFLPPVVLFIVLNKLTDAGFFCLFSESVFFLNQAVFKCCHSDGAEYSWKINGMTYRRYINVSRNDCHTCHPSCSKSSTLTVLGVPQYNNINVTCIASLSGDSHVSSHNVTLQVVNMSENANHADFYETPQDTCVPKGLSAYFFCGLTTSAQIDWIVTDTLQQDRTISINDNIYTYSSTQGGDDSWSVLVVNTSSISNRLSLKCRARVDPCRADIITHPSQLRIKGRLQAPANLSCTSRDNEVMCDGNQEYFRNLTEQNKEHLNILRIDPEIKYCVCVHNLTCGETRVSPNCSVKELPFNISDVNNRPFRVTVSLLNNLNATPAEFEENYACLNCGVVVNQELTEVFNESHIAVSIERYYELQGVIPERLSLLCKGMQMNRTIPFKVNYLSNVTRINLPKRDIFMCQFIANECYEEDLLLEISTYDIWNVSITSPRPGVLQISLNFLPNSSAAGVLLIIARNESKIDYRYHSVTRRLSQQCIESTIKNIPEGIHSVSVFVLDEMGLPFGTTAMSEILAINHTTGPTVERQTVTEYTIDSDSTGVCIHCTFLNASVSDCVAVVHQRIYQHNFSGLTQIIERKKFTRSGDTASASGCIHGVNLEDYQVGVINGLLKMTPSPHLSQAGIIGIVVAIPVGVILIAVVIIVCCIWTYQRVRQETKQGKDKMIVKLKTVSEDE